MKIKHYLLILALLAGVSTGLSQPTITTQPLSVTNTAETTATFSVQATGAEPLHYQWQFYASDLTDQTNITLVLANVQTANAGSYTVVVTNTDGAVTSDVATLTVPAPPGMIRQPANQSASLGANITFTATATGTSPLSYQWRFNNTDLGGRISTSLSLTNAQLTNAGDYTLLVTNVAGSVTSHVAYLEIDATFTKITTGPIVTDKSGSRGGTWGDYNKDGFLDLFVFNGLDGSSYLPFLYRNNGDGTFGKVTNGPPVNVAAECYSACWGDYDNDGNLDLYAATAGRNLLYHNNGNGTFTRLTTGRIVTDSFNTIGAAWGDYDNDGLLDLFVTTFDPSASSHNFLYRNNGDGSFTAVTNGCLVTDVGSSVGCTWGDYDNDGHVDLFVCGGSGTGNGGALQPNRLYHNNGDGTFTRVTTGSIAADVGYSGSCAWGDYDNDGFLDLFVSNIGGLKNFLYHNNGDGTFTRITNGVVAADRANASESCAWGDYDNDGFLDLFVANDNNLVNFLYHNNGDGTFAKITAGSPVNESIGSRGCTWADYDNDGFLDLFSARDTFQGNFLYRNNGNSNSWLTVKLVGTASNRAAIGAKVRVRATIAGVSRWQLRQITGGGGGWGGQNELRANFGLGAATNIDLLRIEWPSGIVQTLTNVAPKQFLTVVEHQQPATTNAPSFTSVSSATNGSVNLSVAGDAGLLYLFEASTNLVNWSWIGARSNATGAVQFTDVRATNYANRFYRVSIP